MREKRARAKQQREIEKISNDLKHAAEAGMWQDVRKIVSEYGTNDAVINSARLTEGGMQGETALFLAAQRGFTETVKELLQAPCINLNINNANDQMKTPLLTAIMNGYAEMAIAMAGMPHINVNMVGDMGVTPLTYAVYHCQAAIPALLAAKSIVINSYDSDRRTALMHAILNPGEPRNSVPKPVMLLMYARDADLDARDRKGWTALMLAAQRGNAEVVMALLVAGANAEIKNYASKTAEDIAVQCKYENIAEILREHTAAERKKREAVVIAQPVVNPQEPAAATVVAAPADKSELEQSSKSTLANSRIMRFFTRTKVNAVNAPLEPAMRASTPS